MESESAVGAPEHEDDAEVGAVGNAIAIEACTRGSGAFFPVLSVFIGIALAVVWEPGGHEDALCRFGVAVLPSISESSNSFLDAVLSVDHLSGDLR